MTLWILCTLGWSCAIFYFAVARARLTELSFTQAALEDALRPMNSTETDQFIHRLSERELADD